MDGLDVIMLIDRCGCPAEIWDDKDVLPRVNFRPRVYVAEVMNYKEVLPVSKWIPQCGRDVKTHHNDEKTVCE
jgi:hypothetical protein